MWVQVSIGRLPPELQAVYSARGRTIQRVEFYSLDRWRVTSDSGTTVEWKRTGRVRPWSQKIVK